MYRHIYLNRVFCFEPSGEALFKIQHIAFRLLQTVHGVYREKNALWFHYIILTPNYSVSKMIPDKYLNSPISHNEKHVLLQRTTCGVHLGNSDEVAPRSQRKISIYPTPGTSGAADAGRSLWYPRASCAFRGLIGEGRLGENESCLTAGTELKNPILLDPCPNPASALGSDRFTAKLKYL